MQKLLAYNSWPECRQTEQRCLQPTQQKESHAVASAAAAAAAVDRQWTERSWASLVIDSPIRRRTCSHATIVGPDARERCLEREHNSKNCVRLRNCRRTSLKTVSTQCLVSYCCAYLNCFGEDLRFYRFNLWSVASTGFDETTVQIKVLHDYYYPMTI